jgi:hypothetical protein
LPRLPALLCSITVAAFTLAAIVSIEFLKMSVYQRRSWNFPVGCPPCPTDFGSCYHRSKPHFNFNCCRTTHAVMPHNETERSIPTTLYIEVILWSVNSLALQQQLTSVALQRMHVIEYDLQHRWISSLLKQLNNFFI